MNNNIDREALRREGWQVIETAEERIRNSPKLDTDEFICDSEEDIGWQKFPKGAVVSGEFHCTSIYRRRIAQPAPVSPSPWIAFKDRKPTEKDADETGYHFVWASGIGADVRPWNDCLYAYTHWMSIPPLPVELVKTQDQLDEEAAEKEFPQDHFKWLENELSCARIGFLAGLRHARSAKEGSP